MKILLSESKLKSLLYNRFGYVCSVEQLTSIWDLPIDFRYRLGNDRAKLYLNNYGPFYLFRNNGKSYLAQAQENNKWVIMDDSMNYLSETELLQKLEVPPIGLVLNDLIELYVDEE